MNPCLNGGTCEDVDVRAGGSGVGGIGGSGDGGDGGIGGSGAAWYKCICPAGYTGKNCETSMYSFKYV